MNRISIIGLLVVCQAMLVRLAWAQGPMAITGRVIDGVSNKPVPFASVYVNASTRGTTADGEGRYQLPGVPSGTVELVASAVGYETVRQKLRVGDTQNRRVTFMLKPDAIGLKAVTVKAKRTGAYNRMLKQFKRELLGENSAADKCVITNVETVALSMNDGHLVATASEPLVIDNNALGYRLTYQLLSFDSYKGSTYYGGVSRFESMKADNSEQTERWERNRQRAYLGSGRHLLASLLAGTHEREGFLVFESTINLGADKSIPIIRFGSEPPTKSVRADSLFTQAEIPSERYFYSRKPLEVFYTRQRALTPYRELPYAYSLIDMPLGPATITVDGWVVSPNSMEMRGALSADRLATLLPADWQPPTKTAMLLAATSNQGILLPPDAQIDSLKSDWIARQQNKAPAVYLQTDKGLYGTGDRLWFSGFSLDPATQLPFDQAVSDEEMPLHVDLVAPGGRLVAHQWIRVTNGRSSGNFRLSDSLATGQYRLRAYTEADRGSSRPAFERTVSIINGLALGNDVPRPATSAKAAPIDVQFLPEGGRWVTGLPARLGIKAVDRRGKGVAITGQILSAKGIGVRQFATNTVGMGSLELVPLPNQTYTAQVRWGVDSLLVTLPAADSAGIVLAADLVTDSTKLTVRVRGSAQFATQPVYLTVQCRGRLMQQTKIQLQKGNATIEIPTAKLPVGVAQVTLFDSLGHAQAERLVCIPDRFLPIIAEVTPNKPVYTAHEDVTLSVRLTDGFGEQVAVTGSAVITDAQQVPDDSVEADIRTHLLLTGELRGRVEFANEYLNRPQPEIRRALDDLLLTQGWRRINWRMAGGKPPAVTPPMTGMTLTGQVFDKKNRLLANANLLLTFSGSSGNTVARTARTDDKGHFELSSLDLSDSVTVQVRPMTIDFKPITNTRVELNVPGHYFAAVDSVYAVDLTLLKPFVASIQERQVSDPGQYRNQDVRQLKEITVKARRTDDDSHARRVSLHGSPDVTVLFDDNARSYSNAYDMMAGRVPGVQVTRRSGPGNMGYSVVVRGVSSFGQNNAPLYLLDGMALPENEDGTALYTINPTEIERIEVLKNGGGAIYGSRGGAGVIAFFSRREPIASKKTAPEMPELTLYGLQTDRQFYTPKYDSQPDSVAIRPDHRDVLYWKPAVATGLSGFSTIKFPLSDSARTIRLRLQGVTTYGRPVSISRLINVR
ncbi:carboxypeptidase-like regulatory domain-containing protein [Fibrella arboris]|uniref:carboxypeptidase-like regulatory domain-containing protein n=1 Tax=Fibrella arboris TaxID=3242486 RepID=UPI003522FE39